ncbi:hypothetical protein OUZ56_011389 [Daphnia magna]|uniref:Uncharacterized protein n=1 Tax=Daphnia magna TaxID=35525 RepID=A0ABQ9Z023_9CRUS|nr:hypothetical protein OUZ56_011389 [Daphnia magna]
MDAPHESKLIGNSVKKSNLGRCFAIRDRVKKAENGQGDYDKPFLKFGSEMCALPRSADLYPNNVDPER